MMFPCTLCSWKQDQTVMSNYFNVYKLANIGSVLQEDVILNMTLRCKLDV